MDNTEIIELLDFKYDVSDIVECSVGEWIQLLVRIVDNENFLILGAYENDELMGYMILRNNITPPVSNSVRVVFAHIDDVSENDTKEIVEIFTEWTKSLGADKVVCSCEKTKKHEFCGFKETGRVSMELKI